MRSIAACLGEYQKKKKKIKSDTGVIILTKRYPQAFKKNFCCLRSRSRYLLVLVDEVYTVRETEKSWSLELSCSCFVVGLVVV